jgi:hypothetical protein
MPPTAGLGKPHTGPTSKLQAS